MKLHESSDQVLIKQVKKGNRLAFNELFNRYWDYLFQVAYKFLKDKEAAKDIVQDVFFDFWMRREFHQIVNIKGFFYQAIRYQSLKHLRSNNLENLDSNSEHSNLQIFNTQEQIDYNELQEKLRQSLNQLPEKHRQIFEMSRFQKLSHQEIANQMQISTRTVEWYIHTVIKQLKTTLTTILLLLLSVH